MKVQRTFGGFAVVDENGTEVKTFTGKGAKAKAEKFLSGDDTPSETSGGRGNHGRGGRGRGNF